jgi:hypothetical protein
MQWEPLLQSSCPVAERQIRRKVNNATEVSGEVCHEERSSTAGRRRVRGERGVAEIFSV